MKTFWLMVLSLVLSSGAMASYEYEDLIKARDLAKECLKKHMNVELPADVQTLRASEIVTLGGENLVSVVVSGSTSSLNFSFQLVENEPVLLIITASLPTGGATMGGFSHRGPDGCEAYRP